MAKKKRGTCCLCGEYKELSSEHSPPRAAFNDNPLLYAETEWIRNCRNIDEPRGKIRQRGATALGEFRSWAIRGSHLLVWIYSGDDPAAPVILSGPTMLKSGSPPGLGRFRRSQVL
jgi:hypothetical protein